jgi:thymidine phosphorylase
MNTPTPPSAHPLDIVAAKRDGQTLTDRHIHTLIERYVAGDVSDALMAAFAMAVCCRGMSIDETSALCDAMVASGERMTYPGVSRPLVDKHSTGGVGDKTSLVLAPMLAAIGAGVPMLSGRGLGHTGGTLDKLESMTGFRVTQDEAAIRALLTTPGGVICAANATLAPADAKLYALRDATATVPALPLIAASIMSKKIAEGTGALVLDVKVGSGAFLPDLDQARLLAQTMVDLGKRAGVRTRALLTDMHAPLGMAVGNALEITEVLETLAGGGPRDLRQLVTALGRHMAELAGLDEDPVTTLDDGRAMDTWRAMVRAQGGDPDAALPRADVVVDVRAHRGGRVTGVDAKRVGEISWHLGAGRSRPGEAIDHRVGLCLVCKPGDRLYTGDRIGVIHASDEATAARAAEALTAVIAFDDANWEARPLVHETIG